MAKLKSEFESSCQTHDVLGIDLSFECLQGRQIVPIDFTKWSLKVHVVSVQRQRMCNQSLPFGDDGETFCRIFHGCNELIVV